ncbi:hypothetical protein FDECE_17534 [Fusarium decemcellulare]|nr:hypothetical protein FDECE_17534 [Fusarium decemcellulare]
MHRPAEVNHPRQAQGPVKAASTRTKKDLGSGQAGNSRPALPSGPVKVWDRVSLTASWSHPHEATMWLFGRCAQGRFLGGDPLAGRQPLYPGASDRHPRTLEPLIASGRTEHSQTIMTTALLTGADNAETNWGTPAGRNKKR